MRCVYKIALLLFAIILLGLYGESCAENGYAEKSWGVETEYIAVLDLTIWENENGEIQITQIGRYSPFRRYSWFRAGDVILSLNGREPSIFSLNSLSNDQSLSVKFKRDGFVGEREISLELSVYGLPPYIFYEEHSSALP